ncbi:MAG: hypothetical protein HY320_01240 [Armatimonadetes bacterium]|nr:hypothetical protein [Armatimonadota bacterium]
MPRSVIVAITALVAFMLIGVVLWLPAWLTSGPAFPRFVVPIALEILLLWGFVVGHRLAWQWGRVLVFLGAVLLTIATVVAFSVVSIPEAAWLALGLGLFLLIQVVLAYVIFFALGTPSARQHFRLICPSCGAATVRAADFFFNKAKCKSCGRVW